MRDLDKLEFRLSQPGLRKLPPTHRRTPLTTTETRLSSLAFVERRSHRRFGQGSIALSTFGAFLGCLTQRPIPDAPFPKYWYGSGGSLYPVRTYLYAKPQRIGGVAGGYYYHDPAAHELVALSDAPPLEPFRFGPNSSIYEGAAFALFLIAHLDAISPVYGDAALRFAWIEAGLITQLLELRAAELQVGTCQLGGGDFQDLAARFLLSNHDVIVHTLVGGPPLEVVTTMRGDRTAIAAT